MFKKLLSILTVICGLSVPALAATSTYTVYSTAGSIVCGSDAVCSTIKHLSVQTVTVSGTAGTALYTWNSTCPSSPDAIFYIRPVGATTGCFVLEGFASSTGPGVSSVTGTTNQITSSPTTGAVVLSLPSTLIAPGTFSSTSINVSGSTPSANGLYLPSANTLGISVNSLQVGRFTSTGLNATNIGATTPGTGIFTSITSNNITGLTQCLQANTLGVISGTGSSCASTVLNTRQVLTSGTSATYTTPAGVKQLRIRMVGAGGGGAGASATAGVAGSNGGDTSFNSVVAQGGRGAGTTSGGSGGNGGTGTASIRLAGGGGGSGIVFTPAAVSAGAPSGSGGNSALGGGGPGFYAPSGNGNNGGTNTGSGGSGAVTNSTVGASGSGGGAGEYVEIIINNPSGTYTYTVGAGGAGGVSTDNGGAGGSGLIIVDEIYK